MAQPKLQSIAQDRSVNPTAEHIGTILLRRVVKFPLSLRDAAGRIKEMKLLDLVLKCSCKPEISCRDRNETEGGEYLPRECSRNWARRDKCERRFLSNDMTGSISKENEDPIRDRSHIIQSWACSVGDSKIQADWMSSSSENFITIRREWAYGLEKNQSNYTESMYVPGNSVSVSC
jgi:hypothetical protein